MKQNLSLLLPLDYVKDVTARIQRAKHRVSIVSMVLGNDSATDEFIDALMAAAKRGVRVEIAADVFTYGELGGGFFPIRYYTKKSREVTRMGKMLKAAGVKFTWLGRTHFSIFSGRMHMKWCIVDDTIYSFGGVNLFKKGLNFADYIFRTDDKELASLLINELQRMIRADRGNYAIRSRAVPYGNDTVLIDGGFVGDSTIYRHVCRLAREATHVLLVSQYCPTGKLSKILQRTDTELYFNPPEHASFINQILIGVSMIFTKNKTLYTHRKYLHAKFMIFDMPDGRRVAITGSHNFVNAGVVLGAREIALQTEDPKVIAQLEEFWRNNVK